MQRILTVGGDLFRNGAFSNAKRISNNLKTSSLKKNNFFRAASTTKDLPAFLLKSPPYQETTLPNQMKVASEESNSDVATIAVWIDAGSVNETHENNGVAHFLEHMNFKGTKRRTRNQLEMEIEDMGGSLNAYTSREQVVFQTRVFKNDVPKAMDILSDMLLNSKYDESAIESERSTILREYEEVSKDPQEVIFDHLHAAAFQGTPLGRTILGTQENIKKISRQDIVSYVDNFYTANRMIVTGAGAVKHDDLVNLTNKYFANVKPSSLGTSSPVSSVKKVPFTGSALEVRDDAMENVHFIVAVEGIPASHPDYFAFLVFQNLVGSWDKTVGGGKNLSSRLCEIVGTEELAEQMTSFHTTYRDTGIFGVYAVAPPEKTENLAFEILYEWTRLGKTATSLEVERAKNRLKSSLLMSLDGGTSVVEDIGRQLLTHGRRLTPAEIYMRVNAVTVDDIMRVSSKHCYDVEPCLVYMGQTKLFPEYHRIRGWTYWNRI